MRTIKEFEEVKLILSKTELLNGKYIPYQGLTKKLRQYVQEKNLHDKGILTKFRNSYQGNKYNTQTVGGIVLFDCTNIIKDALKPIALNLIVEVKE